MENNRRQVKEVNYNRSVPFNTDAEMYVLGSVIIDNTIYDSIYGKIYEEDFYDQKNAYIFRSMVNLRKANRPIGILEILDELQHQNYADIEGMKLYLPEVIDTVASTSAVHNYIDIVEEKAIERRLLNTLQNLSDDILNHRYEFDELLDETEAKVNEILKRRQTSEFITISEAATETLNKITSIIGRDTSITGLDTGYNSLNKVTLGFQKGDLVILAARPSVGKSSYAINLAMNIASSKLNHNAHVAFFTLEMSIEQLMHRIYAYVANISISKIRSGNLSSDELILLNLAKQDLDKVNIHFDANASSKISDIRTKCRQLKQKDQLDCVIIDYLQLITANARGNRQEEVSMISRQLKSLAKELDVPIIALSQLSRSIESREDKEPNLSDLRESGSIEQDADMVMFIYKRSDVEDMDTADQLNEAANKELGIQNKPKEDMIEEIIYIAKNRQGQTTHFDYHFYPARCRYIELETYRKPTGKTKRRNSGMRTITKDNISTK